MKDLDFDELDQAVSSVLGGDAAPVKKDDARPAPADTTKQAVHVSTTPAAPVAPATSAPAISPAVKRRGQFLDMVHPSADMTSRSKMPTPAARTKITPVSKDVVPDPTEKADAPTPAIPVATPPPAPKASEPVISEPSVEETNSDAKDVAWPDPLDVAQSVAQAASDDPIKDDTASEEAKPEDDPTPVTVPSAARDAAATPFVTDAKVDKRPLGAFGTAEVPAAAEVAEVKADIADEQKAPVPTPPELQPDVVSVEAAAEREFTGNDTEPQEKPATGLSQSIPQQYKTPAETPNLTTHPVFDTKEYHQPLTPVHHQKKSRGWLVVLIIVLLLVVGAALGYFAFVAGF